MAHPKHENKPLTVRSDAKAELGRMLYNYGMKYGLSIVNDANKAAPFIEAAMKNLFGEHQPQQFQYVPASSEGSYIANTTAKHEPQTRIESLGTMIFRALYAGEPGTRTFIDSFDAEGVRKGLEAAAKLIAEQKQMAKDYADRMAEQLRAHKERAERAEFENPNLFYDFMGFRVHWRAGAGDGQAFRSGIRAGIEAALGLPLSPPGTVAERGEAYQRHGPNGP